MTDTLLRGPALVVDDTLGRPDSTMGPVVAQFTRAHIPVLEMQFLPELEQVKHWGGFSAIVLDWDLSGTEVGALGIEVGAELRAARQAETISVIRKILEDLYCPIFIVSDQDESDIRSSLETDLADLPAHHNRVLVRSKSSAEHDFLATLNDWLRAHPAVYALKAWELHYESAKTRLFADFESSSTQWPRILWQASSDDSVNQHFELAETLSRNLLHRMDRVLFDSAVMSLGDGAPEASALHRVMHDQAVIDASRLHSDVLRPGDFFFETDGDNLPGTIDISVTADCDLVPREDQPIEDVRIRLVSARLHQRPTGREDKIKDFLKRDRTTGVMLHHLNPIGQPYEVIFSTHREERWGAIADLRRGRLLAPYVTNLQQRFALYLLRPGLPVIPPAFYL